MASRISRPSRVVAKPGEDEIVFENLRAAEAIYFSAMLEEMRLFQVVERIVGMFGRGLLPIDSGHAGNGLYAFWKGGAQRLTEAQRRGLYARVLGIASGDGAAGVSPNAKFDDLWRRFLAAVSGHARQPGGGTAGAAPVDPEELHRHARDLAANLSRHGSGLASYAAKDLRLDLQKIVRLLSDPEIQRAFGARDMWQLIDKVATAELGGAGNSARYRALAQSGSTIIRWLANHGRQLTPARPGKLLDDDVIRKRRSALGKMPPADPTDYDLVVAAEAWLAASGGPTSQSGPASQSGPTSQSGMTASPRR